IGYWTVTALLALAMVFSAYAYFTDPGIKLAFEHIGFPDYFRIELGIAKFIGALILLIPIQQRIKEWAYAGFTITFISAFIAHVASGDPVSISTAPLMMLALLVISYYLNYRVNTRKVTVGA